MRTALLDTSVFIGAETGRLAADILDGFEVKVSVVTVGQLRLGVLNAVDMTTRATRLGSLHVAESLRPPHDR